jgi:hypothetical protein
MVFSGLDDWIYWHFFAITINRNSSHIELLLNDVCLTNISEESHTVLGLIFSTRIHDCVAFYNCHAAGIEVTMSDNSSVFTGVTLLSILLPSNDLFAAIPCNRN